MFLKNLSDLFDFLAVFADNPCNSSSSVWLTVLGHFVDKVLDQLLMLVRELPEDVSSHNNRFLESNWLAPLHNLLDNGHGEGNSLG